MKHSPMAIMSHLLLFFYILIMTTSPSYATLVFHQLVLTTTTDDGVTLIGIYNLYSSEINNTTFILPPNVTVDITDLHLMTGTLRKRSPFGGFKMKKSLCYSQINPASDSESPAMEMVQLRTLHIDIPEDDLARVNPHIFNGSQYIPLKDIADQKFHRWMPKPGLIIEQIPTTTEDNPTSSQLLAIQRPRTADFQYGSGSRPEARKLSQTDQLQTLIKLGTVTHQASISFLEPDTYTTLVFTSTPPQNNLLDTLMADTPDGTLFTELKAADKPTRQIHYQQKESAKKTTENDPVQLFEQYMDSPEREEDFQKVIFLPGETMQLAIHPDLSERHGSTTINIYSRKKGIDEMDLVTSSTLLGEYPGIQLLTIEDIPYQFDLEYCANTVFLPECRWYNPIKSWYRMTGKKTPFWSPPSGIEPDGDTSDAEESSDSFFHQIRLFGTPQPFTDHSQISQIENELKEKASRVEDKIEELKKTQQERQESQLQLEELTKGIDNLESKIDDKINSLQARHSFDEQRKPETEDYSLKDHKEIHDSQSKNTSPLSPIATIIQDEKDSLLKSSSLTEEKEPSDSDSALDKHHSGLKPKTDKNSFETKPNREKQRQRRRTISVCPEDLPKSTDYEDKGDVLSNQ